MIQCRNIISFYFHHIPKLSIGFNDHGIMKNQIIFILEKRRKELFRASPQTCKIAWETSKGNFSLNNLSHSIGQGKGKVWTMQQLVLLPASGTDI